MLLSALPLCSFIFLLLYFRIISLIPPSFLYSFAIYFPLFCFVSALFFLPLSSIPLIKTHSFLINHTFSPHYRALPPSLPHSLPFLHSSSAINLTSFLLFFIHFFFPFITLIYFFSFSLYLSPPLYFIIFSIKLTPSFCYLYVPFCLSSFFTTSPTFTVFFLFFVLAFKALYHLIGPSPLILHSYFHLWLSYLVLSCSLSSSSYYLLDLHLFKKKVSICQFSSFSSIPFLSQFIPPHRSSLFFLSQSCLFLTSQSSKFPSHFHPIPVHLFFFSPSYPVILFTLASKPLIFSSTSILPHPSSLSLPSPLYFHSFSLYALSQLHSIYPNTTLFFMFHLFIFPQAAIHPFPVYFLIRCSSSSASSSPFLSPPAVRRYEPHTIRTSLLVLVVVKTSKIYLEEESG